MQQLLLDILPTPAPSLSNYLPGCNNELLHTLKHILNGQENERFVYLWGGSGCGKSHLLQAMIQHYHQKNNATNYFDCKTQPDFHFDSKLACVAVDDVDNLNPASQIKLFNLYNQIRDESNTVLLVSGKSPPAQLTLRQDLVTRLGWGLIYQIYELTDEEKKQAMKSHAINCGFNLPPEISCYLLRHGKRDLPSLIHTIDALNHYSLANKRQITVPLLRQLLQVSS